MQGGHHTDEFRRLLLRRRNLLERLMDGPVEKRQLHEELSISRSTIDRAVRQLESHDLVRRRDGTVRATLAGRLAVESFRGFCEETETIDRIADLLGELSATVDIPYDFLDGAVAYRSDPPETDRPVRVVTERIASATGLWACASAINDAAASEELYRMVTERNGHASVVYTTELAQHVRERFYRKCHEMAATGRYRSYEADDVPYALFIVEEADDTTVLLVVYDETDSPRGTIVNDSATAVEWANAYFERCRTDATEFTAEFLAGQGGAVEDDTPSDENRERDDGRDGD